ncbi:MAG: hypothetical protein U1E66_01275 [Rhodospirillales bacterium]
MQGEQGSGSDSDTFGYRWTGPGEPGNFAAAHSFCRSTVQMQNFGNMSASWEQRGAGTVTLNMPNTSVAGMGSAYQPGNPNNRGFDSCMQSQGWSQAALLEQQPAATPPAATPAPPPATSSTPSPSH